MPLLAWLAVAVGLVLVSWLLLLVLADPRVPRRAKVAIVFAGLYALSPIDLIPEFIPVVGPLDDVAVVALALRYTARTVPRETLDEAWPGERRILDRLLGDRGET